MTSKKILTVQKIGFQWEMESPFLFCAHHHDNFPPGSDVQGQAVSLAGRNLGSDFSGRDGRYGNGEQIIEPVARYGPFVMTTEQQIREAFEDYRSSRFSSQPGGKTETMG